MHRFKRLVQSITYPFSGPLFHVNRHHFLIVLLLPFDEHLLSEVFHVVHLDAADAQLRLLLLELRA